MILNSFSGGISKSKYQGIKGSWDELVGVNIHDTPGLLTCSQALKKDSGTTVTERVDWIVPVPSGDVYFFSGESGKIWKRASDGTWSLAHTNTNGACLGAAYHNGLLLYASAAKLGKYDFTTWTDSWQDFANDDDLYHPMTTAVLSCQIGDGKYLAQVDNLNTYSSNALDIRPELRISALTEFLDDIIIGTTATYGQSQILRWNGYDDSWNIADTTGQINAFIRSDNQLYYQADTDGSIYYYNGAQGTHYCYLRNETTIKPGATAEYKRRSLIGGTQGVWSLGRHDKDYPQVLSIEFLPSCGAGATIGAIAQYGTNIFVSWKKDSDAGVDIIDTANKTTGYFTSMVITELSFIKKVAVRYNNLPTGSSIAIYSKTNNGNWKTHTTETDTYKREVRIKETIPNISTCQIKVVLNPYQNNSPEIEALIIE